MDLLEAFLLRVSSHPQVTAVEHRGVPTSYGELSALAGRIAGTVQQVTRTVSPRVLVVLPPSTSAYAGMIGTLMAGGTFCPLNIDGPEGRNAAITQAFSPDVVLFEGTPFSFLNTLPPATPRIVASTLGTETLDRPSEQYSEVAYVVFTSGSSGLPKGVKVGRRGFSHFLAVSRAYFSLSPGERWAQFSNLGYDMAIMDVFMALTQGGTLIPFAGPMERLMPATAIKDKQIAIWQSVPSALDLMIRAHHVSPDHLASLRVMSFCGEPLLPRHLKALYAARPDLEVFNTYGTTETTGFSTINRLSSDNYLASCDAATVALGDDVPGWTLSLRGGDSADEGEIVVSSECLSLGYWCDEERTRAAFRQLRAGESPECRSYFTGDWGVRRNSRLYFSSRIDRQVKIRGVRVELGEVDNLLREFGFAAAYTTLIGGEVHSFVESAAGVDESDVRRQLAMRLPFHSIPKTLRAVAQLPRTPNGKIDVVTLTGKRL